MEPETKIPETAPVVQQPISKDVASEPETQDQINWKKFREQREIDRKAKEESDRNAKKSAEEASALKAAMEAILNKPSSPVYQDSSEESEDERVKRLVKAAVAEQNKASEEDRYKREQAEFPNKLTQAYSDFNQVCSSENLDWLDFHYPEVTAGYKNMPDSFDKWANVYKAVKKLMPNSSSKKDQSKAEKNFSKPQSMSVTGATQTGDGAPQQLDDKRKQDNWSRMQKRMKGIS